MATLASPMPKQVYALFEAAVKDRANMLKLYQILEIKGEESDRANQLQAKASELFNITLGDSDAEMIVTTYDKEVKAGVEGYAQENGANFLGLS